MANIERSQGSKDPSTLAVRDAEHDAASSEHHQDRSLNHRLSKNLFDDVITGLYP